MLHIRAVPLQQGLERKMDQGETLLPAGPGAWGDGHGFDPIFRNSGAGVSDDCPQDGFHSQDFVDVGPQAEVISKPPWRAKKWVQGKRLV